MNINFRMNSNFWMNSDFWMNSSFRMISDFRMNIAFRMNIDFWINKWFQMNSYFAWTVFCVLFFVLKQTVLKIRFPDINSVMVKQNHVSRLVPFSILNLFPFWTRCLFEVVFPFGTNVWNCTWREKYMTCIVFSFNTWSWMVN